MNRRLSWALLVAIGMALGYFLSSLDGTGMVLTPQIAHAEEQEDDLAAQVKEIKTQVKQINTLLQSGKLRVVVAIYPDAQ